MDEDGEHRDLAAPPEPEPWWDVDESELTDADLDDSAIGRVRRGWFGADPKRSASVRRTQLAELLIVLALFPLGSALTALAILLEHVEHTYPGHSVAPPLTSSWASALLGGLLYSTALAVPALVIYLLHRSGEGARSINLDRRRWRMDLALVLPVFVVVQWLPQEIGGDIIRWANISGFGNGEGSGLPAAPRMALWVVISLTAGIAEEVVVLGYLVRRLEQRGLSLTMVVVVDVAVRVSYHIYYGWNVLPIALWALVSVLVYLRIRRLWPFIVCHVAWDAGIALLVLYNSTFHVLRLVAAVATLVMSILWFRWRAPRLARDATVAV